VLFWELMTEQVPFPGLNRQKLFQMVAVENYRPQIPDNVPDFVSDLLKSVDCAELRTSLDQGQVMPLRRAIRTTA
jgi:hypothetical protein